MIKIINQFGMIILIWINSQVHYFGLCSFTCISKHQQIITALILLNSLQKISNQLYLCLLAMSFETFQSHSNHLSSLIFLQSFLSQFYQCEFLITLDKTLDVSRFNLRATLTAGQHSYLKRFPVHTKKSFHLTSLILGMQCCT